MLFQFNYQRQAYQFDAACGHQLALPLRAGDHNPNCYHAAPPRLEAIRQGSFVGSVAAGGPVNHQQLTLAPHGNGTHTECYGHLSADPDATVWQCLRTSLFFASLLTLTPRPAPTGDQIIMLADLADQLGDRRPEAVVVRTLPNDDDKRTRRYSGTNPPYLAAAIGTHLAALGVQHLLVDLPSVDREQDGGALAMHRAFWQYPHATRHAATITELIFVDNAVPDGVYLLDLQTTALCTDATPSRPVLYALDKLGDLQ